MLSHWWVKEAFDAGGVALVAAWAIWVIVSITLHELAHGWAAISRGDNTPIETGHMTWNPLVHMGPTSLIVFAIAGIAWGMMPIDPSRMRGRYAGAFVAFAGPLMNFALAIVCMLAGGVVLAMLSKAQFQDFMTDPMRLGPTTPVLVKIVMFCGVGSMLNIGLGVFNLVPCPPLDGSRIMASFFGWYRNMMGHQVGQFASMIVFMLAFFFAGPMVFWVGATTTIIGMGGLRMVLKVMGVGP